ncbi:MAG TPA: type II toxin-antitoxin system RelE/ParE family toxin [Bacteroidia bacterium]|nr:type II toxin-antitoxin system RelE/ParE family toxin [Bacteroidia bacterium]
MGYRMILSEKALLEMKDAYSWYEGQQKGLGEIFLEAFIDYAKTILKNPNSFRTTYKKFREVPLKNFPYLVIYFVDETKNNIVIISVFHTSRHPKKKFRK